MNSSSKRMTDSQIANLAGAICATAETLGQTISASAAQMMAEDLADNASGEVAVALRACRRELTGKLTLAAILQRIQAADGRPGRDEAWSIALASADEFDTVVMTEEIQKAMAAATPILELGDKIGARMAFLSAYDRHMQEARAAGTTAKWTVSLGFDPDRRKIAIENAVRTGLLPAPEAKQEMKRLGLDAPPVTPEGQAIAGLLTGKAGNPREQDREKLTEIKRGMDEQRRVNREKKHADEAERRAEEEQNRQDQLEALDRLSARAAVGGARA